MHPIIQLNPPLLSHEHIKEKIICIRAHRERLFNTSIEYYENKLICHNYGHGGAGWTFLFGCVHESIRQFEQQLALNPKLKNQPIIIIGAGCYGLLTAVILAHKQYNVRILAAEIETVSSYKAAGFFFPRSRKSSTPQEITVFEQRGIESYKAYLDIINGIHPFITQGPKLLPAYYAPDIDPGFKPYISQGLIAQPRNVRIDFGNSKQYHAIEYHTLFINSQLIMQELHRNILELNIQIVKQEITTWHEVSKHIIFNCSGLHAKKLTQDPRIVPVQGHLITLQQQPDINALQYMVNFRVTTHDLKNPRDELIYFAPKEQGILGITFIRGTDSFTSNQHEFDRLLERSRNFFGT